MYVNLSENREMALIGHVDLILRVVSGLAEFRAPIGLSQSRWSGAGTYLVRESKLCAEAYKGSLGYPTDAMKEGGCVGGTAGCRQPPSHGLLLELVFEHVL